MEINEGQTIYVQDPKDANIVKRYELKVSDIHRDKLDARLAEISDSLAELPEEPIPTDGVTDPMALKAIADQNTLREKTRAVLEEEETWKAAIKAEIDKL